MTDTAAATYYAAFDIGIRNLAFCIIDKNKWLEYSDEQSDDPGIVAWENLNLIVEKRCCKIINNKKGVSRVCDNLAAWKFSDDCYYCGKHKLPTCKKYKQENSKTLTTNQIMLKAFTALEHYTEYFKLVSVIVLELQPRMNPKMKTLSNGIHGYFITRYQLDADNLKIIRYSSAKNKLKVCGNDDIEMPTNKKKYDRTKLLAQKYTEKLLKSSEKLLEEKYFTSSKRDDLADAFLHCVWAVNKIKCS